MNNVYTGCPGSGAVKRVCYCCCCCLKVFEIEKFSETLIYCVQAGKTREKKVSKLMDIISHRSDDHFKSFIDALVDTDQEDLAEELDKNLATESIRRRNIERGENIDEQGMI